MIGFFLDPHPEEILYSTIARNAAAMHYPNLRSVGETYFGDPQAIATIALPCRLEFLMTHLSRGAVHTVNSFIDKHTLLPFFAPFLPPARVTQIRSDMNGTQGMGVYMRAGIMASTIQFPDTLRFCPTCAVEDMEQFGERYWHRQHQVPGVYICSKHHVWLEMTTVLLANRQTRHEYITAENAIPNIPSPRSIVSKHRETKLLAIAQLVEWLLAQKTSSQGLEHLQERYIRSLMKRDLASFAGRVRMSEVLETFIAFYSEEFLTFLHCTPDIHSQDNWLARLIRKPEGALHPLHHLLLIHFLGGDIADYVSGQLEPSAPFNLGPWPCLNPVCDHYHRHVIKTCTITYPPGLNGLPSAAFACTCGFTYGRVGPDTGREDTYHRGKIIAVGYLWESALQEYWMNASLSVNRIAEMLGVDPMTVKRHAQRLGLSMVRTKKKKALAIPRERKLETEHTEEANNKLRATLRDIWLQMCQTHGHRGSKVVRQQVPRVYTWLYRHDRDWLNQHLPPRKRTDPSQRVNWSERDKKISQLISGAAQKLYLQPGRPRRITIAAIGRAIGYTAMIQQHLDLLPLTATALAEVEESRIAFAIRRIRWSSQILLNHDRVVKRWELIRLSGVERLLSNTNIQNALDFAINEPKHVNAVYSVSEAYEAMEHTL
jgi:hypothetical protein